jgi:hypothetical protein
VRAERLVPLVPLYMLKRGLGVGSRWRFLGQGVRVSVSSCLLMPTRGASCVFMQRFLCLCLLADQGFGGPVLDPEPYCCVCRSKTQLLQLRPC